MNVNKSLKKIYIILIAIILVVIAIVAILLINNSTSRVVITNDKEEKVMNTNALTMMYETEAGSGEYQVSSDTTWPQDGYIFNERLSGCENGSTLTWDDERKAVILSTNVSDKCYVYFDKEPEIVYFADYIIDNVYVEDGVNGLYYHDGVGTYINANKEAGDNSYRYSGATPNNYVCFGATGADCQNPENQYRIIGIFNNQVKLIKATSYGNYAWDADNVNTWDASTKPDIYTTLNTTYYNTLESEWQNLIAETTWQVGGMARDDSATAKDYYDLEIGTGQSGYEETMKIGLMYVSDYGYGVRPEKWTIALHEENYGTDNWLWLTDEFLISRCENALILVFGVNTSNYGGNIDTPFARFNTLIVRPSFYLESSVQYISGTGTQSDPFRIA